MAVQVTAQQKDLIIRHIKTIVPNCKIWVFGSRAEGRARTYSDLDLGLDNGAAISYKLMDQMEEALAQTNLPFKVDLVDVCSASEDFKKKILAPNILWS